MPAFPADRISDNQARVLYQYLVSSFDNPAAGQPDDGNSEGYGMGPGMMGGNHGGYGMMPGYGTGFGAAPPNTGRPLDAEQAGEAVENYLKSTRNPNLKIGKIQDKGDRYEVRVETKTGSLVDEILVDKNTGQMRSAYQAHGE